MIILICSSFVFGCKTNNEYRSEEQSRPMMDQQTKTQSSASNISISDDVLAEIDPAIKKFSDKLNSDFRNYEAEKSLSNKSILIEAYVQYADYMQYESTVSPMKGKYRKALSLYRKALELDSGNSKVMAEIAQIEDIYKSMGRSIPID
jgi:tetratricopeptide (TPR) repeat protein